MELLITMNSNNLGAICSAWPFFIDWVLPISLTAGLVIVVMNLIKHLFFKRLWKHLWRKRKIIYYLSEDGGWATPYTIANMAEIEKMIRKKEITCDYHIRTNKDEVCLPITTILRFKKLFEKWQPDDATSSQTKNKNVCTSSDERSIK